MFLRLEGNLGEIQPTAFGASMEKTCTACGQAKPLDAFSLHKVGKFGRHSRCKACRVLYMKGLRERNPDYYRTWYQKNKEQRRAKAKEWRAKNLDRAREIEKRARDKYRQAHPDFRRRIRQEVLEAYGASCACCGETTPQFLAVDHIHNDGATHRKELGTKAGSGFYLWLKREGFPKDRFQLLCHNCNLAKAYYGQCPHKTAEAA